MRKEILRGIFYCIILTNIALIVLSLVCYGIPTNRWLFMLATPILVSIITVCYTEKTLHRFFLVRILQFDNKECVKWWLGVVGTSTIPMIVL